MFWAQLFGIIAAAVILWFTITRVRNNPQLFSSANISKSFATMGILALILIGFIALLIILLKS